MKKSLYSLVFTMFNDNLGWSIVLTIFAPLLIEVNHHFLPDSWTLASRNLMLGLLLSCYPLTQFIFMPLIGTLSDHFGRKKILTWTIPWAGFSFLLSAAAILWGSIVLLCASRVLAGMFSANVATAQAAIADVSSIKDKAKNLAFATIAEAFAWIVGPPLGGFLAFFSFAAPFVLIAFLFMVNAIWVNSSFKETYATHTEKEKKSLKSEFRYLFRMANIPHLAVALSVASAFYLGWGFFAAFYPVFLIEHFRFNQFNIGMLSGYLSLFWFIASVLMNRFLADRFSPQGMLLSTIPPCGILILILAFSTSTLWWLILIPWLGIFAAIGWIALSAYLSNLAGKHNQGKVFGLNQSAIALSMCISPFASGLLAAIQTNMPILVGGVILTFTGIFAYAVYLYSQRKRP